MLLLIVLALLALFALIAVTFVILSTHEQRAAESQARVERYADPPDKLLNEALLQVFRGSNCPSSVLRNHSLLEDIYGGVRSNGADDDLNGVIDDATETTPLSFSIVSYTQATTGGQLVNVVLDRSLPTVFGSRLAVVGRVLTVWNKGVSTRIVGCPDDTTLQIVSYPSIQQGDQFIINGAPFSGTGFGYNPEAGLSTPTEPQLTATFTDPVTSQTFSYALAPNLVNLPSDYVDQAVLGGANEDYDAADYQNMLLALQLPNGATPSPSLHRPELVNYWFNRMVTDTTMPAAWQSASAEEKLTWFLDPSKLDVTNSDQRNIRLAILRLQRRIILRPLRGDHPDFTGSNPAADASVPDVYGIYDPNADGVPDFLAGGTSPWDVDNDGDGVADSIWVDVGLPVRSTADGRLYKPLVAVLCVDLDGRFNLNAHGSLAQLDANYSQPTTLGSSIVPALDAMGQPTTSTKLGVNSSVPKSLPRGQGVGVAEVNLNYLFDDSPNPVPQPAFRQLLCGTTVSGRSVPGRYGEVSAVPNVGQSGADPLLQNKLFDYPTNYDVASTTLVFSYGSPMDLQGSIAVGLDLRGQPLYSPLDSQANSPYEMDLSTSARGTAGTNAPDAPFTPAELERILRPYDVDAAGLPGRLTTLASSLVQTAGRNRLATTESWDLPTPAVALPPELRADGAAQTVLGVNRKAGSLVDLLRVKLTQNGVASTELDNAVARLFPPEMIAGLRMDLNRPLGNGRDDNDNNVVDEPGEADVLSQVDAVGTALASPPTCNLTCNIDINGDGSIDAADQLLARQLYARHLYVTMLLLMNYEYDGTSQCVETARQMAQWAVNVVDFRDRDAIMTPFEYDMDPFSDGTWDVDGTIGTTAAPSADDTLSHRGFVWGCERPELLITETLAFHDRRTEDLSSEQPYPSTDPAATIANPKEDDFDQRLRPQGSLFIELHNPWTENEPSPGEFGSPGGVRLSQVTPDLSHPVWRLVITTRAAAQANPPLDPDNPVESLRPEIERSVYFVDPAGATNFVETDDGRRYHPSTISTAAVRPGQYAVIGPAQTTYVGQRADGNLDETRRIVLDSGREPPIEVLHNRYNTEDTNDFPGTDSVQQTPVTVVVDSPHRLSVSEPVDGYKEERYDQTQQQYMPPWDDPLDESSEDAIDLMRTRTKEAFRVVHLQRLANPLMPYEKDTNPYLTIDSMPISLTAFNGESSHDDPRAGGRTPQFHSRQRGDTGTTSSNSDPWTIVDYNSVPDKWDYADDYAPKIHPPTKISGHYFRYYLRHTLGYLNDPFHFQPATESDPCSFVVGWTAAEVGDTSPYRGSPKKQPFPWLTWLNRPLASPAELALVPKARSSQLLAGEDGDLDDESKKKPKFTLATRKGNESTSESYGNDNSEMPFRHLANLFQNGDWVKKDAFGNIIDVFQPDMKLARLLEFVRVPSRFVGTELQGNPTSFSGGNHAFHPPFNRISNYREPGRVNINTIMSHEVWRGIINGGDGLLNPTPEKDVLWKSFLASRQGYGGVDFDVDVTGGGPTCITNMLRLDARYPTRFINPFRSSAGMYQVPSMDIQQTIDPHYDPTDTNLENDVPREVNTTLLRPGLVLKDNLTDPSYQDPTGAQSSVPLFACVSDQPVNDTDRNPAFRYQLLNRLSSIATTRSNVYAVWVTVGYFEVKPVAFTDSDGDDLDDNRGCTIAEFAQIYPDGYQLGAELGSDSGEVKRHRAFSIFDRSIPVGFQRGQDLNVKEAILLRRFIE